MGPYLPPGLFLDHQPRAYEPVQVVSLRRKRQAGVLLDFAHRQPAIPCADQQTKEFDPDRRAESGEPVCHLFLKSILAATHDLDITGYFVLSTHHSNPLAGAGRSPGRDSPGRCGIAWR